MKKSLIWMGSLIIFIFSLSMFTGCAENKTMLMEGASQEQIAADQAATDAALAALGEADRLEREQAEADAALAALGEADRLAQEKAAK